MNTQNIGFAIGTGDGDLWQINMRERMAEGLTPSGFAPDWEAASMYALQAELQAEKWLAGKLEGCRNEGHDGTGDLIGTAWLDMENPAQVALVREYRQGNDTCGQLPEGLEQAALHGIPDEYATIFDIRLEFFALPEELNAED